MCVVCPILEVSYPSQFWLILKSELYLKSIRNSGRNVITLLLLNDWGSHDGLKYFRFAPMQKMLKCEDNVRRSFSCYPALSTHVSLLRLHETNFSPPMRYDKYMIMERRSLKQIVTLWSINIV